MDILAWLIAGIALGVLVIISLAILRHFIVWLFFNHYL